MKTLALFCLTVFLPLNLMAQDAATLRKERDSLQKRGLWRETLGFYTGKLMSVSDADSGSDLNAAVRALRELGAWAEFDLLVENAVAAEPENPALLINAASAYQSAPHYGRLIAGEFERTPGGWHHWHGGRSRGGFSGGPDAVPEASAGSSVHTQYRDRIRSLQLLRQALANSQDASQQSGLVPQ